MLLGQVKPHLCGCKKKTGPFWGYNGGHPKYCMKYPHWGNIFQQKLYWSIIIMIISGTFFEFFLCKFWYIIIIYDVWTFEQYGVSNKFSNKNVERRSLPTFCTGTFNWPERLHPTISMYFNTTESVCCININYRLLTRYDK